MQTPNWFLSRNFLAIILLPLSGIYYLFSKIDFFFKRIRQKSFKSPVICIGGLLAGGVGKTPIVREISRRFPKFAIITRGYGGTKFGRVNKNDSAKLVGDEAKMLSETAPVFVGGNRAENIYSAQKTGFSGIIMDDGFQNPTIKKDISILVFDENLGTGNGFILPSGPMRETLQSGISRTDAIIIIKNKINNSVNILNTAKLLNRPVFYATNTMFDIKLTGNVIAFAGIGYPEKFFEPLNKFIKSGAVKSIETFSFPDHHPYAESELNFLIKRAKKTNATIVTTEKDWVKFPDVYKKQIKFIPLSTEIEKSFWVWLNQRLKK